MQVTKAKRTECESFISMRIDIHLHISYTAIPNTYEYSINIFQNQANVQERD